MHGVHAEIQKTNRSAMARIQKRSLRRWYLKQKVDKLLSVCVKRQGMRRIVMVPMRLSRYKGKLGHVCL